jgi:NAD(P)-dependent dehydrogenase (short-subunit alcohol dehydrogenase family)
MNDRPVALVTGASRGIGKAIAVWLAKAGYDVAATARTVQPDERREHSSTIAASDTTPLPGSLTETAAIIEQEGGRCFVVPADILEPASLTAAVDAVLGELGRIDVLVNNARYVGPGHMDRFMDTPIEILEQHLEGNVIAPLRLIKAVLPQMIERGSGTVVNITSAAAYGDPTSPAGAGGWGMGYGFSKAAFHRIAGFLNVELDGSGVRTFNVQPGSVVTERITQDMHKFGIESHGAPADAIGATVAWLVTSESASAYVDRTIEAQFLCHELGLLPGWAGPTDNRNPIRYDTSGGDLAAMEARLAGTSP